MYTEIDRCRLCKNQNIRIVMDFKLSPLANAYPNTQDEKENLYPLTVVKCESCGHVQLKETVDPKILFSNYLYSSSDSPALIKHFKEYAKNIERYLTKNDMVLLEIGSNDGILLKELEKYSNIKHLIGIDPAENISERALSVKKANIITDFFNSDSAQKIKETFGTVDCICANNVFAHVAELDSMMSGIADCLAQDGVFIFENAYLLDTIKGLYFDQVYHEHLQYYGIKPLVEYLSAYGLRIFDIQKVKTQGGSFRIFAQRTSGPYDIRDTVQACLEEENSYQLYEDSTYSSFNERIQNLKNQIQNFLNEMTQAGKTVSCYGCPAKFALFSNVFGLNNNNIQYVVDDSPLKQNKFSPGSKIPIVSNEHFRNHPTDYCIISVWNMAESIIDRNKDYPGQFVTPMPKFSIQPQFLPYY